MTTPKNEGVRLTTEEDRILNGLISKGIREIKPKRTDHKVAYTDLEDIIGEVSGKKLKSLLKSLTLKGYLKERDYDSVLLCPNCNSSQIYSRYNCPQCQSININRVQLIEHQYCGYIGNMSEFDQEEVLICPKCKTVIGSFATARSKSQQDNKTAIKVIGSSFVCDNCGSKFEKPSTTHTCENCQATFSYREANYEKLPAYELTEKIETLAPNGFMLDSLRPIEKLFTDLGYTVELNSKIKGKSGYEQNFDLIAKKDNTTILLDVSGWGSQNDIVALLGKKMDVDSKSIILLDLAGNPNLASLGKSYNIMVLDGKDEKLVEKLTGFLTDAGKDKDAKRSGFLRRKK